MRDMSINDYEFHINQKLRASCYKYIISELSLDNRFTLSINLIYYYCLALHREGRSIDAVRTLYNHSYRDPSLLRLLIEILCCLRLYKPICRALNAAFTDFPPHGTDFSFFAIKELVFARGYLESRYVFDHARSLIIQHDPGSTHDFNEKLKFIEESEATYMDAIDQKNLKLIYISRSLNGVDTPIMEWSELNKSHIYNTNFEIANCQFVPHNRSEENNRRNKSTSSFVDGATGIKLAFPELPSAKKTMGFHLSNIVFFPANGATELYNEDGIVFPQLSTRSSLVNSGVCSIRTGEKFESIDNAIIAPPLGDSGYFNCVLNGFFTILIWLNNFRNLKLILPPGYGPCLSEFVELANAKSTSIIYGNDCLNRGIGSSYCFLNEGRSIDRHALNVFRSLSTQIIDASNSIDNNYKKLYINRKSSKQRVLVNETEIELMLAKLGFHSVDFGQLSIREQIEIAARAEIIVAPHGAGLTNLVFSQNLSVVVEMFPPTYHVRGFENICLQLGVQYIGVLGSIISGDVMESLTWKVAPQTILDILGDTNFHALH